MLVDLLTNQLPSKGCKLKMGDLEYPGKMSDRTSEFLGRTKINVEEAVVTKPNAKHIKTILQMLGLENAKPSPVPGRKLELQKDKPLSQNEKETYASCVGSAIYLSGKVFERNSGIWPRHQGFRWCHDEVSAITSIL